MNSHFNNTTTPLAVSQTWVGGNEITQPNHLICVSINSSSYCLVTIKQTNDLIHYDQVDSYNVSPATGGRYIQEFCKCTYAHVEVSNVDSVAQTYLSVATTFTNQTQLQDSITVAIAPNQSVNIINSVYQYNMGAIPILAGGKLTSSAVNISNYNLVDVYLLFDSSVDSSDTYYLQISPDNGTTWFPSTYFTLAYVPSRGTVQLNTSATQVRVLGSSLLGNTVKIWITAKST